jgi:LDH2 family malate/lactate/ureidoglycolate dehydrogenase
MRLSWYVDRIRAGVMRAVTQSERIVDAGAVAVVDGHDGVDQVLAAQAAREAIMRSKAHGVATCFAPSVVSTCPSGVEFPIPFP